MRMEVSTLGRESGLLKQTLREMPVGIRIDIEVSFPK
jgi:hypothetical protein